MQFVKLPLAAYDMATAELESTNTNAQHGAIQRPNTKAAFSPTECDSTQQ